MLGYDSLLHRSKINICNYYSPHDMMQAKELVSETVEALPFDTSLLYASFDGKNLMD